MPKRKSSATESPPESWKPSKKYTMRLAPPRPKQLQAHTFLAARQHVSLPGEEPMYFKSHADSQVPMSDTQWNSPFPDDSLPTTETAKRVYVRQVNTAFYCTDHANDSKDSNYIKRFAPGADFYPPWVIEACSWDIVNEAEKIHTHGFSSTRIYDLRILEAIESTKNLYFSERIDLLCRMIENSKFVAVNLLKDEKLITTIAAPLKLYASSLTNNVSNKTKGEDIKRGKAARTKDAEGAEEGVEEGVEKGVGVESSTLEGSPARSEDEDLAAQSLLVLSSSANLSAINRRQ